MGHSHKHAPDRTGRNLLLSILLNSVITLAQIIGGFLSGSLALLSDALHNLTDVISLVISYVASSLSKRKATISRTFGYKRAEIIAAFINASSLIIIAIYLMFEAVKRFFNPQTIEPDLVIWLSILGIVFNGLSVLLLKKDSAHSINIRSAYLHLLTDMLASIAVLIGGLLMKFYQIFWVDAALTIAIALYLIIVGYSLLKESFYILMLFTPKDIKIEEIVEEVIKVDQINNIHHIHVWQLNETEIHLEAHIDFNVDLKFSEFNIILKRLEATLFTKFKINHFNIQPEFGNSDPKSIIIQD
ncbi:cobalt transporter [Formosa sp. Hel1_33_131]|jgi:cobalt-zinc-cadmium efflux system protein|uniref:cation diffusion facilitator family transporter n=1 Tax=Formosa sp. Hel1_33_131 TaxID=1336794 RepID=UPI00084E156F|nr:cation diffusion facilitator family transporter [Formosa sp. Hel1_33_131]AOR28294.1 cobalt transporter [Formosa sp. Hel1_33_131]